MPWPWVWKKTGAMPSPTSTLSHRSGIRAAISVPASTPICSSVISMPCLPRPALSLRRPRAVPAAPALAAAAVAVVSPAAVSAAAAAADFRKCGDVLRLKALRERRQRLGPARQALQRLIVRGIEVQRRHARIACEHRRVIRVRLDVLVNLLLEDPVIRAAFGVLAFAQLVASNFLGLPREAHFAAPRLRHIHVEQYLIGQAFFQNNFRR